ncbi:MAG TPA: 1-acyl-sn-glycerol-3-phosphate acyltransferase, partial [Microthrixaceae bacterium]|nr:1-acyl-sn-glycerol-3-phosphate acyltransferase [Microthrixaceae bacterium]
MTKQQTPKQPAAKQAATKPPRDPRINTRVAPRLSEREILSSTRRTSGPRRTTAKPAKSPGSAERSDSDPSIDELLEDSRADRDALLPIRREPRDNPDDLGEGRISDVNEWGRSEHMRSLARRAYDPIYKHWFRVEWEGLEKIPPGGALLVSNHAGAIPSDAPAIMHGIETELGRPIYGLADNFFRTVPVVGTLWNRLGGLPAHPDNAYRLLREQDQLVLVFPEGTKGPAKTFNER